MNAFASVVRRRSSARRPFWKHDAFWFVGLPTAFVGLVFLLAIIVRTAAG
jgi:hypothetical protein